jgi:hypothetical protein
LLKFSFVVLTDPLDLLTAALLRLLRIEQDQDKASFLNELSAGIAAELALTGVGEEDAEPDGDNQHIPHARVHCKEGGIVERAEVSS